METHEYSRLPEKERLAIRENIEYNVSMKVFLMLVFCIGALWPILSWVTYHVSGWRRWQRLFHREVTRGTMIASSVSLKKFGGYNRCVRVGVEDYGVAFQPSFLLPSHGSFCIPWVQILSFGYNPGKRRRVCVLQTAQGTITVVGEVAEIVARGCASHFVQQRM